VARGEAHCTRDRIRGYVELHIEQGPVLVGRDTPLALVTGIRGSFRYRDARILGEYGHSGACRAPTGTTRSLRRRIS
jgi:hypothetical protein